jgi:hypothetical protein
MLSGEKAKPRPAEGRDSITPSSTPPGGAAPPERPQPTASGEGEHDKTLAPSEPADYEETSGEP